MALIGFVAAPSAFAQAPAVNGAPQQAAPQSTKAPPSSFALVDVGYILKNHPNMNANMETLKAEMTQAQEDIETRRKTLLAEQESLSTTVEAGSPLFKQKQENLISQESKLRVDFMAKEKEFAEKQANVIFKSYQSINNSISIVAKYYQFDIVLRYSGEQNKMDPKDPKTVNFGIQRDVLYHNPQIDITEAVLGVLNSQEPKAAAPVATPSAPATRQATPPLNNPTRR